MRSAPVALAVAGALNFAFMVVSAAAPEIRRTADMSRDVTQAVRAQRGDTPAAPAPQRGAKPAR